MTYWSVLQEIYVSTVSEWVALKAINQARLKFVRLDLNILLTLKRPSSLTVIFRYCAKGF